MGESSHVEIAFRTDDWLNPAHDLPFIGPIQLINREGANRPVKRQSTNSPGAPIFQEHVLG